MANQPQRPTRSLANRVAIVTGAGSKGDGIGNGRAAAILLAEAGASVVCVDLSLEDANGTVAMIMADGKGAGLAITGDVTDEEQCKEIVKKTAKKYGRLDILVNNVGIMGAKGTAEDVDMVEWEKSMRVNVSSMVMMAKYSIPEMVNNEGQWKGSIVNLASVAGIRGGTPSLLYPTSKGAVVNLTRAMAVHHAPQGIRVNCVCSDVESASIR
jgi:NAD(P)-dependent dehydrogenase (short-subunit alcohol dehydrogenase family)